jgi:hypothetical protein
MIWPFKNVRTGQSFLRLKTLLKFFFYFFVRPFFALYEGQGQIEPTGLKSTNESELDQCSTGGHAVTDPNTKRVTGTDMRFSAVRPMPAEMQRKVFGNNPPSITTSAPSSSSSVSTSMQQPHSSSVQELKKPDVSSSSSSSPASSSLVPVNVPEAVAPMQSSASAQLPAIAAAKDAATSVEQVLKIEPVSDKQLEEELEKLGL